MKRPNARSERRVQPSKEPPKTFLLVDDNHESRMISKLFLSNLGYVVHASSTAEEALSLFDSKIHDLVVTDNSMPGISGEEMSHIIKMRSPTTPVIMYSGGSLSESKCIDAVVQKTAGLTGLCDGIIKLLRRCSTSNMSTTAVPESLLLQIAQMKRMEPGKLCIMRRGRKGPYYNLQCREGGKTLTQYIPAEQSTLVAEHTANYRRFRELVDEYSALVVAQTRAERMAASATRKTRRPKSS